MRKLWLFFGIFLIIVGTIFGACLLAKENFDFRKFLIPANTITGNYNSEKTDTDQINIDVSALSIKIHPSDNEYITLDYEISADHNLIIEEENNCLIIKTNMKWYNVRNFAIFKDYRLATINLYVPNNMISNIECNASKLEIKNNYFNNLTLLVKNSQLVLSDINVSGDCNLDLKNGDFEINNITANNLKLLVKNGKLMLSNINVSGDCNLDLKNGEFDLFNMKIINLIKLEVKNGEIKLKNVDCSILYIKNSNCDLELLNTKSDNLSIDSNNSSIKSQLIKAENISINSMNGKVDLDIDGNKSDYKIIINVINGFSNIDNKDSGDKLLNISITNGKLNVIFTK